MWGWKDEEKSVVPNLFHFPSLKAVHPETIILPLWGVFGPPGFLSRPRTKPQSPCQGSGQAQTHTGLMLHCIEGGDLTLKKKYDNVIDLT